MLISPYKSTFLYFGSRVWSCFVGPKREMTPYAIQMGHFYDADNFLGHSYEVYLPQSLAQA